MIFGISGKIFLLKKYVFIYERMCAIIIPCEIFMEIMERNGNL